MIDSHCHLDHEPLLSDLDNVIQRSKDIGIKKILTISTSIESFYRVKEIVRKDNMIFGTIGIHPHEADNNKINLEFARKQVCIYAYTFSELKEFNKFSGKSYNENLEDIEILRFLDLNRPIKMVEVSDGSVAVDVKKDIKKVIRILKKDG